MVPALNIWLLKRFRDLEFKQLWCTERGIGMDFLPDIEKFRNFFDGTDSKNEISIAVEEAKKYDIFNFD